MKKIFSVTLLLAAMAASLALVVLGTLSASTFLILLGIAGVPLVLVGTLLLHYVNVIQRAGDLGQMQKSTVHAAAGRLEAGLSRAYALARQAHLPEPEVQRFLDEAAAALAPRMQMRVTGTAVVLAFKGEPPGGNWVRKSEQAIGQVLRDAAARCKPLLEPRVQALGLQASLPAESLAELCWAYLETLKTSGQAIRQKIETVERAIAAVEAEVDVGDAWNHTQAAKKLWADGEVELAMKALEDAEGIVHEHLRPPFIQRRDALLGAVDAVRRMEIAVIGVPHLLDGLNRLHQDVQRRDVKAGLPALQADEVRFIGLVREVTNEARARMARIKDALAGVPGLSDRETLEDLDRSLRDAPDVVEPYEVQFPLWHDTMELALARMSRHAVHLDLVRVMDRMNRIIAQKLKDAGQVRASDLPVRERGEQILEVYARMNPGVVLKDGVLMMEAANQQERGA